MKEKIEIQEELNKETPNWDMIILLAKKASIESLPTNEFGFKLGIINFVKVQAYRDQGIFECLNNLMNINFLDGTKTAPFWDNLIEGKINIIISDKETIKTQLIRNNIPYNKIRISSNDNKDVRVFSFYQGEERKRLISIKEDEIKSYIRDEKLRKLLEN